jgi:ESCRT-II complex subunit VPS36
VLERSGGMLALTDVYCLYNRARVTELVSPEDLLEAAKLLAPLGVGMRLRSFASGLQVVQLDSFSDAATGSRIAELLGGTAAAAAHPSEARYITALQLAAKWKIPLQIAQQQLLVSGLPLGRGSRARSHRCVLVREPATKRWFVCASNPSLINLSSCFTLSSLRLQLAESTGSVCRDDSINGLRFYPNLFAAMPG